MPVPDVSLYVHLPWCVRKCPYCDFNSHRQPSILPERAYLNALLKDLEIESSRLNGRPLVSIFFGGGTPSLFSAQTIHSVIDRAAKWAGLSENVEITLEANPGTIDVKRFQGYKSAGVNRLSVGVQSFSGASLQRIGRIHDGAAARRAVTTAFECGFTNINLDLMYGLPEQTTDQAIADFQQALAFRPAHLSAYQLTIEPRTPFYRRPPPLPDHDALAEMEMAIHSLLLAGAYQRYEISAFAQPGMSCRHNINYWAFGDYIGIGAGAHGKLTSAGRVMRNSKISNPLHYLNRRDNFLHRQRVLNPDDLVFEYMLNRLRLTGGFHGSDFTDKTGIPFESISARLEQARRNGWLALNHTRVSVTRKGLLFLNDLQSLFLPERRARHE